jgi:hypothetical protein
MAKMGAEQKDRRTGPLEALKESNFARETDEIEPDDGEAARCGYIAVPYVTAGPALDNTMIKNTVASRGSLGNDGTSRDSYTIQPNLVDADDAEEGMEGTGIPAEKGRKSIDVGEGHKK